MPSLPRYAASTTRKPMPSARSTSPDPVSSAALCRYVLRLLIRRPLPLLMGMRKARRVYQRVKPSPSGGRWPQAR